MTRWLRWARWGLMLLAWLPPAPSWALSCTPLTHQAVLVCDGSPARCTAQFVILEVPDFYCRRHPHVVAADPGLSEQLQQEVQRTGKSFAMPRLVVAHLTSLYWDASFDHTDGMVNYAELLRAHERPEVGWIETRDWPSAFWLEERAEFPSQEHLTALKQEAQERANTLRIQYQWFEGLQWALLAGMTLSILIGTVLFVRRIHGPLISLAGVAVMQLGATSGLAWLLFEVNRHSPVTGWAALGVLLSLLVAGVQVLYGGALMWRRR